MTCLEELKEIAKTHRIRKDETYGRLFGAIARSIDNLETSRCTGNRPSQMTELKDTIGLMCSADYKERFKAEYYQLKIRYEKLAIFTAKWDDGQLDFTPTCPRSTYDLQLEYMQHYLAILEMRAKIESIEL